MKNLKRVLSLALASVMVIGMMVVGTGAADFKDADKIVNEEAVNTLVALGVVSGKEDGSYFDPTGIVTRAEMAKMITVALNGGKDPILGTKATPSYTDIKGTWAEAYIEYCTNLGIVSGKAVYEKIDTVIEGKVTKMKDTKVMIDGEWYVDTTKALALGSTYKNMPVIDGYIFTSEGKTTKIAADEYALLVKAEGSATGLNDYRKGILLLTDGTKITVDLKADYTSLLNALVTFDVDDDVYELKAATAQAFDGELTTKTYKDGKIDGKTIDDDAVIFMVNEKGEKAKVITGAELKKTDSVTVTVAYVNENSTTGFKSVAMAFVKGTISSTSDNLYGYITSKLVKATDDDDKTVYEITLWNGTETVTLTTKADTSVANLDKGSLVVYKTNTDGLVTSIKLITATDAIDTGVQAYINAVTAVDGDDIAFKGGTVFEITEDTVVLYINSADVEGVANGIIVKADKDIDGNYINNVYAAANAKNEIVLLVVDDANEMK